MERLLAIEKRESPLPFLKLPAELRLVIYGMVFDNRATILNATKDPNKLVDPDKLKTYLYQGWNLVESCPEIARECHLLYQADGGRWRRVFEAQLQSMPAPLPSSQIITVDRDILAMRIQGERLPVQARLNKVLRLLNRSEKKYLSVVGVSVSD